MFQQFYNIQAIVEMLGGAYEDLAGKKILCTGTSGFLGQWILRTICYLNENVLKTPCSLIALDINDPDEQFKNYCELRGVRFVNRDLTAQFTLEKEMFDYIVHMAGIASPAHYKKRPLQTINVALEGSRTLLELARHSGAKYLFCSSSEVYQTATVIPTPESYIGAIPSNTDRSCYDVSKLMGENFAYVYAEQFNVSTSVVRIFNSFGPGLAQSDLRILPKIVTAHINKEALKIYASNNLPSRTYCPAANTMAGLLLALLRGGKGKIYNIGASSPELTVVGLLERIEDSCGIRVNYDLVPPPPVYETEPQRRCPDITLAQQDLGYFPRVGLDEGLQSFFEWALVNYQSG